MATLRAASILTIFVLVTLLLIPVQWLAVKKTVGAIKVPEQMA